MISKKLILACLCAVLITISLIHPLPARAATSYYVSKTGSDANAGTLAQPFLTISKGIGKLVAGDTLYIRAGTYAEVVSVSKSGTSSAPITISGYPGEHVVVAPQSASSVYTPAISLNGNYINIQNLEATFPNAKGMDIPGSYNKVDNLDIHTLRTSGMNIEGQYNLITNSSIHEAQYQGIFITGSNNTLEGNKIYKNVLDNDCPNGGGGCNGDWPGVVSIGDSGTSGGGSNTVFRGNQVYENYGEGILCMYNTGVLVEGNTVRDNLQQNIYFDQCSNSTIRNNLVYYTTNHEYWLSSSHPQAGIEFANEGIQGSYPVGHDIKIYNNIVVNNGYGIAFWVGRAAGAAILNTIVANNTLVNNTEGISFDAPRGANSGSTIENNIVMGGSPFAVGSTSGLTFTHNLYSKTPSYLGAGDMVADPLLVNSGQSVVTTIDPGWYKLTSASPAIGKALVLSDVVTDYFGTARGSSPDIGAHENTAGGTPVPTSTSISTRTATSTPPSGATATVPAPQPTITPLASTTPTRTPAAAPTVTSLPTNPPLASSTPTPMAAPTAAPTASPAVPICNGSVYPCSIWGSGGSPSVPNQQNGAPIELGLKFRADVAGRILGVRFYKGSSFTGAHIAHLWASDGSLLAIASFVNETSSGWQEVTFNTPVTVAAGTTYIASYSSQDGWFNSSPAGLTSAVDSAPLHALKNGSDGLNGVYYDGGSGFPNLNYNSSNYWVDVIFTTSGITNPTPTNTPLASSTPTRSPAATATPIQPTSTPLPGSTPTLTPAATATTVQPTSTLPAVSTPTRTPAPAATALLPTNTPPAAATPTSILTATSPAPQPTSTPLPSSTPTPMSAPPASPVPQPVIPACNGSVYPCSIWGSGGSPSAPNQHNAVSIELGLKFRADVAGQILGVRFYKGSSFTGAHIAHLWASDGRLLATANFVNETSSGWQKVTFATPVTVAAGTTYVVSYYSPDGWFNSTPAGLAKAVDSGTLHALKNGFDGMNGLFNEGGSAFPKKSWNSSNYWVDVVFSTSVILKPTPTRTPAVASTATQNVPLPGAFRKSRPVNGTRSTLTSLTLTWTSSSKSVNYEYCIDTINDQACNTSWVSTNLSPKVTLGSLRLGTYYWQVRAKNSGGITYANGKSSSWWSFTIAR